MSNQSSTLCPPPPSASNYKQLTLPTFPRANGRNRRLDLRNGKSVLSTLSASKPESMAAAALPGSAQPDEVNPSLRRQVVRLPLAQPTTPRRSQKLPEPPFVGEPGLGVGQCFNVDKALGTTTSSHCCAANSKKLKMDPQNDKLTLSL